MDNFNNIVTSIDKITVAITANRKLAPQDYDDIFEEMSFLITSPNIEAIYFGGAVGGDTVALKSCLDIVCLTRPRLIVVVPNRLQDQPRETHAVSRRADEIIELGMPITSADGWRAYKARNEYMVDHADHLVAFWNKSTKPSGTGSCISYAYKVGKTVKIIEITGEDK